MKLPSFYDIYPLTIVLDRYGGTYSDGVFTAWNCYADEIPTEIDGSDLECWTFWEKADRSRIGFGDSVNFAIADLYTKLHSF